MSRYRRYNLEGGLDYDDGTGIKAERARLASKRTVAYNRQRRNYYRLREQIDAFHVKHMRSDALELPQRLIGWNGRISSAVITAYPEVTDKVRKIERVLTERNAMRADPSHCPASGHRGVPLPKDPVERDREMTRRSVESMRKLRERRRLERGITLRPRVPLPTDPEERKREINRRKSESRRRLKAKHRLEKLKAANLYLIQ